MVIARRRAKARRAPSGTAAFATGKLALKCRGIGGAVSVRGGSSTVLIAEASGRLDVVVNGELRERPDVLQGRIVAVAGALLKSLYGRVSVMGREVRVQVKERHTGFMERL